MPGSAGRRLTWLTLRHTAASLMFDAGLTIFEVQQRLGHRSPTMTAEVYTHLMRERYEEGREMTAQLVDVSIDLDLSSPALPPAVRAALCRGHRRTTPAR